MIGHWREYASLKKPDKRNIDPERDLINLAEFHRVRYGTNDIVCLPAYAQAKLIYQNGRIVEVDPSTYAATPAQQHVNVFDQNGPTYREDFDVIYLARPLATVVSDAAHYIATHAEAMTEQGPRRNCRLLIIDGLRSVDAGYLMAASNPNAVESKLLAKPGTSAHNKGMAVDCSLFYLDDKGTLMEADMLGHMDHADMKTNHRNFAVSDIQRCNRLTLERPLLRGALTNGMLLAPLREEFWDFRFPEYEMDLWRVLESIARCIEDAASLKYFGEVIDDVRRLALAGAREEIPFRHPMNMALFRLEWQRRFNTPALQLALEQNLGVTQPPVDDSQLIFHGDYNILYDADLPLSMRQANPALKHLFE